MMYRQVLPLLLLLLPALGACAASKTDGCKAGADCPSGVCNVDGTCGDAATATSSGTGTGTGGAGGSGGSATASSGSGGEAADGAMATSLVYATPIKVLSFPIKAGVTWKTSSTITGKAQGIPISVFYAETYDSKVDAHGTMKTPFATFPVLRIRVNRLSNLAGIFTTSHRFVFATECFSTVATMVSKDNETVDEFTTAAEVSRLAP